jgi:hypothetical protein
MTDTSLLPMAARAAGYSLADVCDRLLRAALDRTSRDRLRDHDRGGRTE